MIFPLLDFLGLAVFAVSGALAAERAGLDLLGVIIIATVTAVGGGTLRDLLINRHPIFWIANPTGLLVAFSTALLTVAYTCFYPAPDQALLWADTLGLAFFSLAGAEITKKAGFPALIIILMGTITGVAGGLLRDVLCNRIPLILQRDLYATAAIAGIAVFLLLNFFGLKKPWAFAAGFAVVLVLRYLAITQGLHLPQFQLAPPSTLS